VFPGGATAALLWSSFGLQLDVLKRAASEYSLPVEIRSCGFQLARWISSDDRKKLERLLSSSPIPASPTTSTATVIHPRTNSISAIPLRADGINFFQSSMS